MDGGSRLFGFPAHGLNLRRMADGETQHRLHQRPGGGIAVSKGLEHVRLGHEADGVVQRRVPGGEARHFQRVLNAVVRDVLDRVHIRAGGPSALVHVLIDGGHHGFAQKSAQRPTQFVGLGVDQGHGVAVICTVGRVGVNHHIRAPFGEKTVEHLRGQRVAFDEIAVQVQIAPIRPKTE